MDNLRSPLPNANPTTSVWISSHPSPLAAHRSSAALPNSASVIIVGSGITAAFAARELLSTSSNLVDKLLVLEARGICSGATGRNGGHLQPVIHEQEPDVLRFELACFEFVVDLIKQENIACDFRRLSGVLGFWSSTSFEEATGKLNKLRGKAPELAQLVEVVEEPRRLEELRLKGARGAIVQSVAASLSPYKLVTGIWGSLLDTYGEKINIQTHTPVTVIRKIEDKHGFQNAWAVDTPRGTVSCRYLLLATNGYTSHLLPQFGRLITPTQLSMTALRPDPSSSLSQRLIENSYGMVGVGKQTGLQSDHLVQQPLAVGAQFMFGGARAVVPGNGVGVADDSFVTPEARDYLMRQLEEMLDIRRGDEDPAVALDSDGEWTGIAGYTRDEKPWVGGLSNENDGVFVAAGYTGHGMTNAPLSGKMVGSLIAASLAGEEWKEIEQQALQENRIPRSYVISAERLGLAG